MNTTNNASILNQAADFIGTATEWTADVLEGAAFEAGVVLTSTVRRTERVAVTLVKAAPSIWEQSGKEADARLAARLAKRGITLN